MYRKDYDNSILPEEVESILNRIANDSVSRKYVLYLEKCLVDTAKKNLYETGSRDFYQGVAFAIISLKEELVKRRVKEKKDLTREEKNDIDKKRSY
jgi:hypothetical protein